MEVWSAWRDGMQAQGRLVAVERLDWDTLPDQDKVLDRYIGARVAAMLLQRTMNGESTSDL